MERAKIDWVSIKSYLEVEAQNCVEEMISTEVEQSRTDIAVRYNGGWSDYRRGRQISENFTQLVHNKFMKSSIYILNRIHGALFAMCMLSFKKPWHAHSKHSLIHGKWACYGTIRSHIGKKDRPNFPNNVLFDSFESKNVLSWSILHIWSIWQW